MGTADHRAAPGRPAEALEKYQAIRTRLVEEFGADPSAELQRAHTQVLTAEDVPEWDRGPTTPRQLPPDVAGFTGRAGELAELDRVLAAERDCQPPIAAVHGPGGIGKTALAVHWAHRVSPRFPDGQVYLDMRGYGPGEPVDPTVALDVVLRAVGVPPTRVPPGKEERSALLRTRLAERRTLLLLDNVRDADQARPLLPGGGNLVLITGRSELRGLAVRDGAFRCALGELPSDESTSLIAATIGTTRAGAEPAAVAELVALCGRLPLALVVAAQRAARYPDAPIAELVTELRAGWDRLNVLSDPTDLAADPRAVFSWSYRALSAEAAQAFRYLGLHPGPEISLPVAMALLRTTAGTTRRLLDSLVSVHLLEHDQRNRYRFHDLLRVYAAERAAEEDPKTERDAAMGRMLDWYLHTLHRARVAVFAEAPLELAQPEDEFVRPLDFATMAEATAWYDTLRATLLAVVEYAAEHRHDRHGWQLAFLLRHFQEIRRHGDDELRCAEWALGCAKTRCASGPCT
ncbi:MAG: hypothetical protein GEU98_07585 [Pseudonocardiaceae bacterium]|nr:hypothetical protein [Pseudonocardiaceae bacterium]